MVIVTPGNIRAVRRLRQKGGPECWPSEQQKYTKNSGIHCLDNLWTGEVGPALFKLLLYMILAATHVEPRQAVHATAGIANGSTISTVQFSAKVGQSMYALLAVVIAQSSNLRKMNS